ncbi:probable WRKY transcription factor 33 isoform X2 [Ananas comosus]|uniref:Probable WRKY transcription factor 33 isoform X2 n=1 Tax=Ananas comosus TaxID=4615 RepID=A0A6P5GWA2_ANACO|nr:probable WRKY transcription factor 33 isoform X2 [Ananas comosus]
MAAEKPSSASPMAAAAAAAEVRPRATAPPLITVPVVAVPCFFAPAALIEAPGFAFAMTHQAVLATVTAQAQIQLQAVIHPSPSSEPLPDSIPQKSPSFSEEKVFTPEKEKPSSSDQKPPQPSLTVVKTGTSDGYSWRKYGQKQVKSSENSRSYYRCTDTSCLAKKKIERRPDGRLVEITYKGRHNHEPPQKPKCPKERGSQSCGPPRESESSENTKELDPSTRKTEKNSAGETPERNFYCSSDCEGNAGNKIEEDLWKEPDPKRRMIESATPCPAPVLKTVREPKIIVQAASDAASVNDGYRWRKYGQKIVKGNPNPRSYYRCTRDGCPVRKHVERASDDAKNIVITYEGKHNHDSPSLKNGNDSRASPHHLAAKVAVKGEQTNKPTISSDQNPMEESKPVLDGKSVGDKALELGGEKALESAQTLLSIGFNSSSGDHDERSNSGGIKHPLFNEKPAAVQVQNS